MLKNSNHNEPFAEGDRALVSVTESAGTDKDGNDAVYKNLKAIYPAETHSQTAKNRITSR